MESRDVEEGDLYGGEREKERGDCYNIPAIPQRPNPELNRTEPLLMSATASSALATTFDFGRTCDFCCWEKRKAVVERNRLLAGLAWTLGAWRSCAETAVMREREHRGAARGRAALGLIGRRSTVAIVYDVYV